MCVCVCGRTAPDAVGRHPRRGVVGGHPMLCARSGVRDLGARRRSDERRRVARAARRPGARPGVRGQAGLAGGVGGPPRRGVAAPGRPAPSPAGAAAAPGLPHLRRRWAAAAQRAGAQGTMFVSQRCECAEPDTVLNACGLAQDLACHLLRGVFLCQVDEAVNIGAPVKDR